MTPDPSTRARLIASAVQLFQAKGYAGVGIAEILTAANAPKGCLYHHFPFGKEGLAVAAVEAIAEEVDRHLQAQLEAGATQAAIIIGIATATADWLTKTYCQQGALIGTIAASLTPETPDLRAAVTAAYARWRTRFAATSKHPETAEADAHATLCMLEGAIIMARAAGQPELLVQTARAWVKNQMAREPTPA
jgi:TetR/AcrR family transcriptional regulator, lmrAB and yxaGH operons repressor